MIFLVVYLIGFALSILPIARWFLSYIDSAYPGLGLDSFDYCMATVMGFLIGSLWPLVAVCVPFYLALCPKPERPVSLEKR